MLVIGIYYLVFALSKGLDKYGMKTKYSRLCKQIFLNKIPNYGSQCSVILFALTPPQGPFPATYISNYVPMLIRESFSITIF